MLQRTCTIVLAVAVVLAAMGSFAQAANLLNGSFELPVVAGGDGTYADNTVPLNWISGTYGGGGTPGTANPFATDVAPVHGTQVAYLYDIDTGGTAPFLAQNLGVADAGVTYSLSGLVGDLNRPTSPFANNFPAGGASINLHVGSTAILDRVASVFIPASPGDGVASLFTTPTWLASGGEQLFATLVISGNASPGELEIASFDDIRLNQQQAVPEPSTLVIFTLIGVVMALCGRRALRTRRAANP